MHKEQRWYREWAPSLILTGLLAGLLLCLDQIPSESEKWRVATGLPHHPGYPAGIEGLRPVSLLELLFLEGGAVRSVLIGCLLLGIAYLHRKRQSSSRASLLPLLPLLLASVLVSPRLCHGCPAVDTWCKNDLCNGGTAVELFREKRGRSPETLEFITQTFPRLPLECPLTHRSYSYAKEGQDFSLRCGPHPAYYGGNQSSLRGDDYLSLRPGGTVHLYSSRDGLRELTADVEAE